MLITIPSLLGPAQLAEVDDLFRRAPFRDGRLSAGMAARRVKHNEELDQSSPDYERLNALVLDPLLRHRLFRSAVLPHRFAAPFYARYGAGMGYGDHIDDPVMGSPHHYRTDVSVTVFLSPPESYQGGELVVRTEFGDRSVKLPAGHAVVYPSSSLHHVNEVTAGERRVMVMWIQSMVRDPARRELLHRLNQVRERALRKAPGAEDTKSLDIVYANLLRMWAEV